MPEGTIAQTATAFNAGVLPDVQVYLGPEDFTVAAGKVVAWRDSSGGRLATQAAEGEVTLPEATFSGSIVQTISLFSPGELPGAVVYLAQNDWALVSDRVSRWRDTSTGAQRLASQTAEGELTYSGEVAQTATAATQAATGWVPTEGEIAQAISAATQTATGWLPLAAQIIAPATQAATGEVYYAPRWGLARSVRVGTRRIKRVYRGSTLIHQFPLGNLFDADGNQLTIERADGTVVTLELE